MSEESKYTKQYFKKLWMQMHLKRQERLKIQEWDRLTASLTKRIFIIWVLLLITIWTIYGVAGLL